jgi:hypothetical protein
MIKRQQYKFSKNLRDALNDVYSDQEVNLLRPIRRDRAIRELQYLVRDWIWND